MAEFDNYKKRTAKEKETTYKTAMAEAISSFLPLLDSINRAIEASGDEGIQALAKQLQDILTGLGVIPIVAMGEKFDPDKHNAIMHVDDENYEDNVIIEEFATGYILEDRVIRHSVVKVAN